MPTDKALPNVQQTINLPNPKEVQVQQQQQTAEQMMQPVDIQRNDDGSADVTFDPSTVNPGQGAGHFSNLADLLPDDVLDPLDRNFIPIIKITRIQEKTGNERTQAVSIF